MNFKSTHRAYPRCGRPLVPRSLYDLIHVAVPSDIKMTWSNCPELVRDLGGNAWNNLSRENINRLEHLVHAEMSKILIRRDIAFRAYDREDIAEATKGIPGRLKTLVKRGIHTPHSIHQLLATPGWTLPLALAFVSALDVYLDRKQNIRSTRGMGARRNSINASPATPPPTTTTEMVLEAEKCRDPIRGDAFASELHLRLGFALACIHPNARFAFITRLVQSKNRPPLEKIAASMGYTRERVRQLTVIGTQEFEAALDCADGQAIRERARAFSAEFPNMLVDRETARIAAGRLLDVPDGRKLSNICLDLFLVLASFGHRSGDLVMRASREDLETAIKKACYAERVRISQGDEWIDEIAQETRTTPEFVRERVEAMGYERVESRVIIGRYVTADILEAAFENAGRPLTVREAITLADFKGKGRPGARNVLIDDARFTRIGMTTYALTSWGYKPFVSIEQEIRDAIREGGGKASYVEISKTFPGRFRVRKASVEAGIVSKAFILAREGTIRLRHETNGRFHEKSYKRPRGANIRESRATEKVPTI